MLTDDGCGVGNGARAARVDVAKSARERLYPIGPTQQISEKNNEGAGCTHVKLFSSSKIL
jgi:hypothetical protein